MLRPLAVIALLVDQALLHQLVHHCRHAAGVMIVLAEIFSRGLKIDQKRHGMSVRLPIVERERHADVPCDRGDVIGALVEPPIAELTTMAFRNASRVRISEGFRSSCTIPTMRLPVS